MVISFWDRLKIALACLPAASLLMMCRAAKIAASDIKIKVGVGLYKHMLAPVRRIPSQTIP